MSAKTLVLEHRVPKTHTSLNQSKLKNVTQLMLKTLQEEIDKNALWFSEDRF